MAELSIHIDDEYNLSVTARCKDVGDKSKTAHAYILAAAKSNELASHIKQFWEIVGNSSEAGRQYVDNLYALSEKFPAPNTGNDDCEEEPIIGPRDVFAIEGE